jgi:hypothetical protein
MVSAHTSVLPPFPVLSWRYTTPIRKPLCVNNFSCDCPGASPASPAHRFWSQIYFSSSILTCSS